LVGWRSLLTDEEKQKVIHKINYDITPNSIFSTFYQVLHNVPNGAHCTKDCMKYFNEKHQYFTISMGAQYIVPKQNILSRPLHVWKRMHQDIYNDILNGAVYFFKCSLVLDNSSFVFCNSSSVISNLCNNSSLFMVSII